MRSAVMPGSGFDPQAPAEALEPRVLLASAQDLAVVGLTFDADDGLSAYFAEIDWGADRSCTGDLFLPGPSGPSDPTPITLADLIDGPGGSLRSFYHTDDFDSTIGSRVSPSGTYPAGWISGAADDDSAATFALVVERASGVTAEDIAGNWAFQFTRITGSLVQTYHSATVAIGSESGFIGVGFGAFGDPPFLGEGFQFDGDPDNGRFDVGLAGGGGAVMFVSKDKSVIVTADVDESDGDTWVGVLVRHGVDLTVAEAAGSYRVGMLADGSFTEDLFDGPTDSWRVDLNSNGTYRAYDLAASDSGAQGSPVSQGVWTLTGGTAVLTDSNTALETTIKFSENGATALVMQFRVAADSVFERPLGLATRIGTDATVSFGTSVTSGILDADGRPLVFDLRQSDDSWSVADLDRYALGASLGADPADIEAFQASDGRLVAVVTTDTGLMAIERGSTGFWRSLNLTTSLTGAENIVSTITVYTDKVGISHVAGVTGNGEVVTYKFDPTAQSGAGAWSYLNLSDVYLTPQGEATPQFVGPLISYVTDWNGLNIAGLDADGNIKAVWSGNGGFAWHAADLTAITNAPAMASGLTAYLTSWGGINIVGLDAGGRMVAAWWVPGFGGVWKQADLTAAGQGPLLTGASLTSFVAPWGGLNIAGIDANGDVIAYWWSPETENDGRGWEVANLTRSIPNNNPRPTEQLHSQTNTTHGGEMNVLGTDSSTGKLLRLYFRVDAGAWTVQNVTDNASYI